MWRLCVTRGKPQQETIEPGNPEQSNLSYDELCQSVHYNVEQLQEQLDGVLEQLRNLQSQSLLTTQSVLKILSIDTMCRLYGQKSRIRSAVASPHNWDLDEVRSLVQKVQDKLVFFLSKDTRESRITAVRITEQRAELYAKTIMITNQLRAQREQNMSDRSMRYKRLLHLLCIDGKQPKIQYEEALRRAFEFNKEKVPKYRDVLGLVERDTSFQTWKKSEASSVLILAGHSSGTQASHRFCWISAAVMDLIDRLRASECHVAFFIGQTGTTLSDGQARSTDREALHSVIGQAASWDPSRLQKIDYEEHIAYKDWDSNSLWSKTLLLQALVGFQDPAKPVYLVFDNLHMGYDASTGLPTRRKPVFIKRLLELVRDVQGIVKILLVGLDEDFDKVGLEIFKETLDCLGSDQLLYRLGWDSAKIRQSPFPRSNC
ncbi:MAG: hypothetical protein Q9221_003597 [Calogaya cf. arnoldii]